MALVSASTVTAGSVLTATLWNTEVAGNLNDLYASRRLAHTTKSYGGSVFGSFTATSVGAATDIFDADISFTAAGSTTYWVEFYCPLLQSPGGSACNVQLTDGGNTSIQIMFGFSAGLQVPVHARVPYTPSAGTRTLNARFIVGGGTGYLYSQSGASGQYGLMYLSVYGPSLT